MTLKEIHSQYGNSLSMLQMWFLTGMCQWATRGGNHRAIVLLLSVLRHFMEKSYTESNKATIYL